MYDHLVREELSYVHVKDLATRHARSLLAPSGRRQH